MTKKSRATKRRRHKRNSYRLIWLGVLRGELKITQELMQSIGSPEFKSLIAQAAIKRMIDPKAAYNQATQEAESHGMRMFDLCPCVNQWGLKPLASKWHPPKTLRALREYSRIINGLSSYIR